MVVAPRPERWQSAFVCPELDSAVVPSVRGQPGTLSLFVQDSKLDRVLQTEELDFLESGLQCGFTP